MSMIASIQGQILEVTVVGCQKMKDTKWFSRQDPYVVLEYSGTKYRTEGGKNAEKFMITLIEGFRDLKVAVWKSNTFSADNFIGNATIQLQKVLTQGYEDCTCTLQTETGKFGGEARLILHYAGAHKHNNSFTPSTPTYAPQVPHYSASYPVKSLYPQMQYSQEQSPYQPASPYPPAPSAYPPPPPPCSTYPPPPYPPPPPPCSAYPPQPSQYYHPQMQYSQGQSPYPPASAYTHHPSAYPPPSTSAYPPAPSAPPYPPQPSPCYYPQVT